MSRIAFNTFRSTWHFGSVTVTETSSGELWARITLDGVVLTDERIDVDPDPLS